MIYEYIDKQKDRQIDGQIDKQLNRYIPGTYQFPVQDRYQSSGPRTDRYIYVYKWIYIQIDIQIDIYLVHIKSVFFQYQSSGPRTDRQIDGGQVDRKTDRQIPGTYIISFLYRTGINPVVPGHIDRQMEDKQIYRQIDGYLVHI